MVERGQALALSLPRLLSSSWSSETILHLMDESFVSDLKLAWSKLEPIPKMRVRTFGLLSLQFQQSSLGLIDDL